MQKDKMSLQNTSVLIQSDPKREIIQHTMMGNGGSKFIFKLYNCMSKWERALPLTSVPRAFFFKSHLKNQNTSIDIKNLKLHFKVNFRATFGFLVFIMLLKQ